MVFKQMWILFKLVFQLSFSCVFSSTVVVMLQLLASFVALVILGWGCKLGGELVNRELSETRRGGGLTQR